jgi:hypothetical protein
LNVIDSKFDVTNEQKQKLSEAIKESIESGE